MATNGMPHLVNNLQPDKEKLSNEEEEEWKDCNQEHATAVKNTNVIYDGLQGRIDSFGLQNGPLFGQE